MLICYMLTFIKYYWKSDIQQISLSVDTVVVQNFSKYFFIVRIIYIYIFPHTTTTLLALQGALNTDPLSYKSHAVTHTVKQSQAN